MGIGGPGLPLNGVPVNCCAPSGAIAGAAVTEPAGGGPGVAPSYQLLSGSPLSSLTVLLSLVVAVSDSFLMFPLPDPFPNPGASRDSPLCSSNQRQ